MFTQESNRDFSQSSCVEHLQPAKRPSLTWYNNPEHLGRQITGVVVQPAAQINVCAWMMRPRWSEWEQAHVCLEESSIVFGPCTSVLCFFSSIQETWQPCAEEPFGTGQGRGNVVCVGGTQCKNMGHFKAGKQA